MVLCILPDRRSDAGVPDDWRAANRRSESRGGITGKPFIGWPPSHTGCYDDNDSVPDLVETNMLELNINGESTDRDKFDDGQELFGNTYCPGSGNSWGYGALPRDEDWGVIFAEMPAWVRPPGTTYTSSESFNSLGWYEEPGAWRFGIDFEGNSTGRPYPYRFAIGSDAALTVINGEKYLMPGQRATIVGHLQIIDKPPRIALHYWAGLIHEDVRIVNDHVDPQVINIGF